MTLIQNEAPIIPFVGLGRITLYSTIDELRDILSLSNSTCCIINGNWIRYDIQNCIELYFHRENQKLFRITTLDDYRGTLFGTITIGTTEEEMLKAEPSFIYDDFEETWESIKGVFIEMDAQTNTVRWISVYIKELDTEEFEQANW